MNEKINNFRLILFPSVSLLLFPDAREEVRSIKYKELREAVLLCDEAEVRIILGALGSEQDLIVNMAPAGANTLIFSAAQSGNENIVTLLLEAGADGRAHSVTKYSPLYTAVHNGHTKVTKMLLERFSELIQVIIRIYSNDSNSNKNVI